MTIIYIFIFLILLSIVVAFHELGHLTLAKIYNVYCDEYSIGFGPKILKKKFKYKRRKPLYDSLDIDPKRITPCMDPNFEYIQSETTFSIGVIPLGGYVSMAGEENTFEDKDIPKERTINGINHAKQISIFLGGITVNFILAILLFFFNFAFTTQTRSLGDKTNEIVVSDNSLISKAGLKSDDRIIFAYQEYHNLVNSSDVVYFPNNSYDKELITYSTYANSSTYELVDNCVSYAVQDCFLYKYYSSVSDLYTYPSKVKNLEVKFDSYRIVHIKYLKPNDKTIYEIKVTSKRIENEINGDKVNTFELLGISPKSEQFKYTFSQAVGNSFKQFGNLFVNLYKGIFSIFTPKGWSQTGGIISVYQVTTNAFRSSDISYFLLIWGYISLNLGCFNLLPFPGLDGWQTFIALIETISRKKISTKTRGIFNFVGMIILFAFASVLIVKDIIRFI